MIACVSLVTGSSSQESAAWDLRVTPSPSDSTNGEFAHPLMGPDRKVLNVRHGI